ncbi:CRISPR-associated endonuclease Cas3'' [Rhodobacter capsulatus]|uniref:CRISPR-associated endonuclease Cas3'' n=1 Tax=Rhodobacter capsulatus TaxID=1061 RepID=UPI0003D3A712|nr:CRISPR-associated endonuclease Cas3'' [Rhodobacter capsulatus]ETD02077.1 CRISPR-associated protein Cas3 [Rhodobacter capsulatus DE442]ETD77751.1 CRISPR-associated protein Cas3 [Rhodobacter capsulatus R121]ETE54109.1 CRISPR-associated protein Cas3 [Rhodobacter capsulatus Y262]MDS0926706.1 CRISPR-associated endonuclease Cas3'' [Rhodobacter capsulatus]TQD37434.1 CRISPR-associated endonuclease Cas3'' [Rhodobacter capsulatus]
MTHYAHSGTQADRSDWQTLLDHLRMVALLAQDRGAAFGLGAAAELAGRLHDLGKYDPAFDRVLCGEPGPVVDHSTAGGRVLLDPASGCPKPVAEALAQTILGHHAGLPDTNSPEDGGCLVARIARPGAALAAQASADMPEDFNAVSDEFRRKLRKDKAGFDFSVATRMVFSCLVDADYRDTEAFYDALEGRSRDRDWPALQSLLPAFRARFDAHMAAFDPGTDLNRLRAEILAQVRAKAALPPGLFTLSVPTGGGKTLASLGFALDHAACHGHRRIIYAIPFTSIIDQTVQVFADLLGAENVLEHHSAIEIETPGPGRREAADTKDRSRDKVRQAMEDWAAPVVVTTNVQLFESLFAARPSRCRKLHNIAGSVIVLDEAQCLPRKVLLPTLAMLDTLCAHYGCTVVLCTATQPAFDSAQLQPGGLALAGRELAPDPGTLAGRLRRARIVQGGAMDDAGLVAALAATPQGFVIVNSRRHALALYRAAEAAGLEGLLHLTTRQYPAHRREIIEQIRARLKAGQPCRLIATSLIEAGVDLDFPCGWRAEAGLDSVIQAAGRVNREGKRPLDASVLTVFSAPDNAPPGDVAQLAGAMQSVARGCDDLLDPAAIRRWFEEVYWRAGPKRLDAEGLMDRFTFDGSATNFAFRTVAERYRMIDSPMVPVIVARDETAADWVARLSNEWEKSGPLARALQPFTVQIPQRARETLRANDKGDFEAAPLRGDAFFVLSDGGLYRDDFGLWWEQADYLSADQSVI